MSDNDELNKILKNNPESYSSQKMVMDTFSGECSPPTAYEEPSKDGGIKCQWETIDGKTFFPCATTKKHLTPGMYNIQYNRNNDSYFFEKVDTKSEDYIISSNTKTELIINEIKDFWQKKDCFREYNLTYKRGIILWGPAGGGKSVTISLIVKDVIEREGVCFIFDEPSVFKGGLREFRKIEPDTPVVAILEDMDSILELHDESEVLNLLDGLEKIDNIIFIATTNYPENLGARIINRPSRFDKRFKIDYPTFETKKAYLESLLIKSKDGSARKIVDVDKWCKESKNFTFAHLKELFIAVVILGNSYDESLATLKTMIDTKPKADKDGNSIGFGV